ncbi:MAG: hypothetical protein WC659_01395 [Patescibacteria group bacterium]
MKIKCQIPNVKFDIRIWDFIGIGMALIICVLIISFSTASVRAQNAVVPATPVNTECGKEDWNKGELCHPFFNTPGGLLGLLGTALQMVMGLVGVVSFIMVILGAVRWMTAGGNSESVEKGKGMIVWAFLGLALAAASFAILDVFFKGLQKAFYSA